ncbi:hypothetical protein ABFA07_016108 [Porites harrisoni]
MVKVCWFWFGVIIQLTFLVHSSEQFQDHIYESIIDGDNDDDGASNRLNDAEYQKILLQYDKNGDGELSSKEMEQYFHDAMASVRGEDGGNKAQDKKAAAKKGSAKQKNQKASHRASAVQWSLKQLAGGVLGILGFIALCAAYIRRSGAAGGNHQFNN